jgi:hypothetical protein
VEGEEASPHAGKDLGAGEVSPRPPVATREGKYLTDMVFWRIGLNTPIL